MDEIKALIQQKLIANVLMEKCASRDHIIFSDALCSQERVIRFKTQKFGDKIMYEVNNGLDSIIVNAIKLSKNGVIASGTTLHSWDITNNNLEAFFNSFDNLIDKVIPAFENGIGSPDISLDKFVEGEKQQVFTTKYERNRDAREACLAYYGYRCRVCGMSFEETYGEEFKGIIEVHHIVPISEIGETYVVDPIKDLVPLCPNCHTAIHSKYGNKLKIK